MFTQCDNRMVSINADMTLENLDSGKYIKVLINIKHFYTEKGISVNNL